MATSAPSGKNVNHLAEMILDRYILDPSSLSSAELEEVRAHLKECARCSTVHEYLEELYESLEAQPGHSDPRLETLGVSRAPARHLIVLRPIESAPGFVPPREGYSLVLAAETAPTQLHRFASVATLFSEKEQIIARILHDNEKDHYRLYLIAEDTARVRHKRVSFPALGITLTTDGEGVSEFSLEVPLSPTDWKALKAVIEPS